MEFSLKRTVHTWVSLSGMIQRPEHSKLPLTPQVEKRKGKSGRVGVGGLWGGEDRLCSLSTARSLQSTNIEDSWYTSSPLLPELHTHMHAHTLRLSTQNPPHHVLSGFGVQNMADSPSLPQCQGQPCAHTNKSLGFVSSSLLERSMQLGI